MNTSKILFTLGVSSLVIFSGCQSESEKTPEAPKSPQYSLQEEGDVNTEDTQEELNADIPVALEKTEESSDQDSEMDDPLMKFFEGNNQ